MFEFYRNSILSKKNLTRPHLESFPDNDPEPGPKLNPELDPCPEPEPETETVFDPEHETESERHFRILKTLKNHCAIVNNLKLKNM